MGIETMKGKHTWFITILVILILFAAGLCANQLLLDYYGNRWLCVSNVSVTTITILWLIFTFDCVSKYQAGPYLWDKLLGESERVIERKLLTKCIVPAIIFAMAVIMMCNEQSCGIKLLIIVNLVLLCHNSVLLIMRYKYKGNIAGKLVLWQ